MERKIKRGDMYYANLINSAGSEQKGYRPVLVLSNNIGNKRSNTVIVSAITSKTERKHFMPTHCRLQALCGLSRVSYVLLEQIYTLDKSRLKTYIGTLSDELLHKVDKALAVSVGLK